MNKAFAITLATIATLGTLSLAQTQTYKNGLEVMQAADARAKPKFRRHRSRMFSTDCV